VKCGGTMSRVSRLRRILAVIMSAALMLGMFSGCSKTSSNQTKEDNALTEDNSENESMTSEENDTENDVSDQEESDEEELIIQERKLRANGTDIRRTEGHYEFQTHVSSTVMNEIMTQDMLDGYNNLVDAVLAGENSFECKDEDTYLWIMGQYPYLLFPVIDEYVTKPSDGNWYEDGKGYIEYTIPYEEFKVKLNEFEDIVVEILNDNLEDDYSEFEKALALYQYFINKYDYDYETYEKVKIGDEVELSAYRLLTGEIGICQEISVAYSYLLLQAGVDATVMKGVITWEEDTHQWSYVTIDGKNYHVDPTFGLGQSNGLAYFMMTDEKRSWDGYLQEKNVPSTVYAGDHEHPNYLAEDETYCELWDVEILYWDSMKNVIVYKDFMGDECEFEYE